MNQNGFPPMYCFDCELDLATWDERMRAWRKANAHRGRYYTAGKPEKPRGCGNDVLAPCCSERFGCGEKHGHPTDEEETELKEKFDRLIWGPPNNAYDQGTIYRGIPQGACVVCDEPATKWIGQNRPVCRACYAEVTATLARQQVPV